MRARYFLYHVHVRRVSAGRYSLRSRGHACLRESDDYRAFDRTLRHSPRLQLTPTFTMRLSHVFHRITQTLLQICGQVSVYKETAEIRHKITLPIFAVHPRQLFDFSAWNVVSPFTIHIYMKLPNKSLKIYKRGEVTDFIAWPPNAKCKCKTRSSAQARHFWSRMSEKTARLKDKVTIAQEEKYLTYGMVGLLCLVTLTDL